MNKKEAISKANQMVKELGPEWKACIFEHTPHWFPRADRGIACVHYNDVERYYTCYLGLPNTDNLIYHDPSPTGAFSKAIDELDKITHKYLHSLQNLRQKE